MGTGGQGSTQAKAVTLPVGFGAGYSKPGDRRAVTHAQNLTRRKLWASSADAAFAK
jgi:hypothetical protein